LPVNEALAIARQIADALQAAHEQAKGRAADKRSDVWAFGAVLYEMLTGRRAFEGEDLTDTIAAVMRAEPDWSALPSETTPVIRTLLKRCLEKDRKLRIADISTAHFLLAEPAGFAAAGAATITTPRIPAVAARNDACNGSAACRSYHECLVRRAQRARGAAPSVSADDHAA
jgi:serine/threonine protein kinase